MSYLSLFQAHQRLPSARNTRGFHLHTGLSSPPTACWAGSAPALQFLLTVAQHISSCWLESHFNGRPGCLSIPSVSQGGTYKAAMVLIDILSDSSLVLLHCSSPGSSKPSLPAERMWLPPGEGGWRSRPGRNNPGVSLQPWVHCSACAAQVPPNMSEMMLSLSPALGRDVLSQSCPLPDQNLD